MSISSFNRRQVLSGLMKLLVFIGLAFVSIPFISSFSSSEISDKQNSSTRWVIQHPVSDFSEGQITVLNWVGGVVWVYQRSAKDIELLKNLNATLRDPMSAKSDQASNMKPFLRSADERYFVFIPKENKRQCQVRFIEPHENEDSSIKKFREPCYGAFYDAAGRVFKNSGEPEQQNLAVPKHVVEDGVLKIGIWTPKI